MKKSKIYSLITLSSLLFFYSQISHGIDNRYSGSGGSYRVNLQEFGAQLDPNPVTGSNGETYYSIAPPGRRGFEINRATSHPEGQVRCRMNYIIGPDYISEKWAYHRLLAYMPEAGFKIDGEDVYRINSNTYFTLFHDKGMTKDWVQISARFCSIKEWMTQDASWMDTHFPFEIRIFIKNRPVDGNVIIPQSYLGGYTRMFQYPGKPNIKIPPSLPTIKLYINQSIISYNTICTSSINNLNINHQTLDSSEFNSTETRNVTYNCSDDRVARIKLDLDYMTDNDPQKRVPLTSGANTIYSDLILFDRDTNQRGKTIETSINGVKNIQIESHISGLNAAPGDYSGSAWLIATYL